MSYTVGQVVGIFRTGSWSTVTEGKYTVVRVTKMKVTLARLGDGYNREFSAKTGHELGEFASKHTYIVSEVRYDQHVAMKEADAARARSVNDIKEFAAKLSDRGLTPDQLTMMRALLDEAEKFVFVA